MAKSNPYGDALLPELWWNRRIMVGRVALPGFDSDASKASRAGRGGASLDTAFVWFNFGQQNLDVGF